MKSERLDSFRILILFMAVLFSFFLAGAASALTCADVEFNDDIRSRYPDINEACLGVIEKGGDRFARMEAKVVRASSRRITLRYRHQDGTWGSPYRTNELPMSFRVDVEGRKTLARDLVRDQELEIYVMIGGQYAVQIVEDDDVDVVPEAPPMLIAFVPVPVELPSTGSLLPLIGAVGSLSLVSGAVLTWRRKARS